MSLVSQLTDYINAAAIAGRQLRLDKGKLNEQAKTQKE